MSDRTIRPVPHRAVTLIELLVVVAIIALIAAIFLPSLPKARAHVRNTICKAQARQMAHPLDDCDRRRIRLQALSMGCYGKFPQFRLPEGVSEEAFRQQLQDTYDRSCGGITTGESACD